MLLTLKVFGTALGGRVQSASACVLFPPFTNILNTLVIPGGEERLLTRRRMKKGDFLLDIKSQPK